MPIKSLLYINGLCVFLLGELNIGQDLKTWQTLQQKSKPEYAGASGDKMKGEGRLY